MAHIFAVHLKQAAPSGLELKIFRIQRLQGAVNLVPIGQPDDGKLFRYFQRTGRDQLVKLPHMDIHGFGKNAGTDL